MIRVVLRRGELRAAAACLDGANVSAETIPPIGWEVIKKECGCCHCLRRREIAA